MKKTLWGLGLFAVIAGPVGFILVLVLMFSSLLSSSNAALQAQQCAVGGQSGDWAGTVAASSGPVRWPVTGAWSPTSEFGMRENPGDKLKGRWMMHNGLDMAMTGRRPVVAVKDGVVKRVASDANFGGNQIYVDIGNNTVVGYSHLRDPAAFKPGDKVSGGQTLGIEGATGNVKGPHLHFSVQQPYGKFINPRTWFEQNGLKVPALFQPGPVAPPPGVAPAGGGASAQNVASSSAATPSTTSTSTSSASSADAGMIALPKPESNRSISTSSNPKPIPIPANYKAAYDAAAARFGIPWTLIAGIGAEETRQGALAHEASYAGAKGPMQWMPQFFPEFAIDGDGDGTKDFMDVEDAIFTTANSLAKRGAKEGPAGVRRAIFAYNHADWYVNDVLYWAQVYGGGSVPIGGSVSSEGCTDQGITAQQVSGNLPAVPADGGRSSLIVQAARSTLGTPYAWAGGTINGPSMGTGIGAGVVGYDCSGLTLFVVYRGTGIKLPHKADEIAFSTQGQTITDKSQLKPGDVIAFSEDGSGRKGTFGHIGIYVGGNKMIHAPHQGSKVEETTIDTPYWSKMAWSMKRFSKTQDA